MPRRVRAQCANTKILITTVIHINEHLFVLVDAMTHYGDQPHSRMKLDEASAPKRCTFERWSPFSTSAQQRHRSCGRISACILTGKVAATRFKYSHRVKDHVMEKKFKVDPPQEEESTCGCLCRS